VLHNIAILANDDEPPVDPEVVVSPQFEVEPADVRNNDENTAVRRALLRTHFA
jgi:hypothetical protein